VKNGLQAKAMTTPRNAAKPYWEMDVEELAATTREFDSESGPPEFRPLSAEKQEIWKRLQIGAAKLKRID